MQIEKPNFVTDEHLTYLDTLRESGVTNMFGAAPYIMSEFPDVSRKQALEILQYWMDTFGDRNP